MITELPPTVNSSAIYSPSEVARMLNVSYPTVWRWMNAADSRRRLRCGNHRHNGRPFVKGQELIRFFHAEA